MSLPAFGVRNPVPANLLMVAALVIGVYSALTMRREFFPEVESQAAYIIAEYPGATPEEIEESIVYKLEDSLVGIDEIKQIKTTVREGSASIVTEFEDGVNVPKVLDEIERVVDQLQDLPADAERLRVTEMIPNMPVIQLNLWGDANEEELKRGIRRIKQDLESLPRMGSLMESGVREYEVSVQVDFDSLLQNGLSMPMVSRAISAWMNDLPSGVLKTDEGNINVRTVGVGVRADAIAGITLRADPDGSVLTVGDVAEVREGYVDADIVQRFNELPGVNLTIFREGSQDAIEIADMAKAYVAG
ncbi:MAG: efflux RND transporter permease subunit, partial [Planctomycetota bacterium]|nr:efflux RND transporter permease subunit [Planctomycetota bacterium]